MTRLMVLELILTRMVLNTKAAGKMINNMELEQKGGQMELSMKDHITKERKMEKEN